jgi:hypothetical protein
MDSLPCCPPPQRVDSHPVERSFQGVLTVTAAHDNPALITIMIHSLTVTFSRKLYVNHLDSSVTE